MVDLHIFHSISARELLAGNNIPSEASGLGIMIDDLTLLVGGTRLEREQQMDKFQNASDFMTAIIQNIREDFRKSRSSRQIFAGIGPQGMEYSCLINRGIYSIPNTVRSPGAVCGISCQCLRTDGRRV